MSNYKAYSGFKELKRGDAVWPVMSSNSLTFAYVTDDGRIATQEAGEAVTIRPASAFVSIGVVLVSSSNP